MGLEAYSPEGGWKVNTQYVISATVKPQTVDSYSNKICLSLNIEYTDGTNYAGGANGQGWMVENEDFIRINFVSGINKTIKKVYFYWPNNKNAVWIIKDIMVEEGSTASEYEEYNGKLIAKDEYARSLINITSNDIDNISGILDNITGYNNNLWKEASTVNVINDAVTGMTRIDIYSTSDIIPAGTYTISCIVTTTSQYTPTINLYRDKKISSGYRIKIIKFNNDNGASRQYITFTIDNDVTSIIFAAADTSARSAGNTAVFEDIMLEEGEIINPYQPRSIIAIDSVARNAIQNISASNRVSNIIYPGDLSDHTTLIYNSLVNDGVANLSAGTFYLNGLNMPIETTICGVGNKTVVKYIDGGTQYCIKMNAGCKIHDMKIMGQDETYTPVLDYTLNTNSRSGIYIQDITSGSLRGSLHDLEICNFNYAGIKVDSNSYYYEDSTSFYALHIHHNNIGIYFAKLAEYNRVTNCNISANGYGIINNGGNNYIANNAIDGNYEGILTDAVNLPITNELHGAIIGNSINHTRVDTNKYNMISFNPAASDADTSSLDTSLEYCYIGTGSMGYLYGYDNDSQKWKFLRYTNGYGIHFINARSNEIISGNTIGAGSSIKMESSGSVVYNGNYLNKINIDIIGTGAHTFVNNTISSSVYFSIDSVATINAINNFSNGGTVVNIS